MVSSDITIKNSTLLIDEYLENTNGSITVIDSLIRTTYKNIRGEVLDDFDVYQGLTVKNSVLIFNKLDAQRISYSNSMLLGRFQQDDVTGYVLLDNAAMTRSFSMPDGVYIVPEGVRLSVKKGANITFHGELYVYGWVSEGILCPTPVGSLA